MNPIPLETTPRVYYAYYRAASYDFYPSLSRRIGNGETLRPPTIRLKKLQQTNFISLNTLSSQRLYNQEQDPLWRPRRREPEPVLWDLYPAVLRNVENFGTEQMRQRLRVIMRNT